MNFVELLAKYPRIVIAGPPRTGKTILTQQVSDRPVIHTDDWMDWPWREVPVLVAAACQFLDAFVLEGVRAPDALREGGLEIDCVVWLSTPKVPQTDAQRAMGLGVHTVLSQWSALHQEIPIVTEEQLTLPTLDHADLHIRTRRFSTWTLDASQIERTPQGGLRIPARVSKAGVFKYQRGKHILREYRPASELRKPQALASFKGAPIVVLHPAVNGGAVDTENAKKLAVGHFEDPFFNEDSQAIEGWVVTNDADTIRRIEAGDLSDISSAYDNGRDFNPGFTADREPFDLTQINYVCNHIALGPPGWGRQGQDVGLLTLDANDNQVAPVPPSPSEEDMTVKPVPNPPTKDSADALPGAPPAAPSAAATPPATPPAADTPLTGPEVSALREIAKMLPALNKLINTGNPEPPAPKPPVADSAPPTADAPKPEEKKTMDAKDIERIAQEGIEVRSEAIGVLGETYSPKGKSTRDVKVDVIRTFDSKFTADGKTDDAIGAAYDIALKAGTERNKNANALAKTRRAGTVTLDEGEPPPRKPIGHQAYEAWREPSALPAAKN